LEIARKAVEIIHKPVEMVQKHHRIIKRIDTYTGKEYILSEGGKSYARLLRTPIFCLGNQLLKVLALP
jgi:hypothetical protein